MFSQGWKSSLLSGKVWFPQMYRICNSGLSITVSDKKNISPYPFQHNSQNGCVFFFINLFTLLQFPLRFPVFHWFHSGQLKMLTFFFFIRSVLFKSLCCISNPRLNSGIFFLGFLANWIFNQSEENKYNPTPQFSVINNTGNEKEKKIKLLNAFPYHAEKNNYRKLLDSPL